MSFMNNHIERHTGMDLNGDGYIGGQGFMSKLERATHVDFNGDGIIGRLPDTISGGYIPPFSYGSSIPPMNYGDGYNGPNPY